MSIFDKSNRPGRDQATGWFKFNKIGDKIGGEILDIFYKPATGIYKEQRAFTIKDEVTGTIQNVGIKMNTYTLPRTDMLQIGDSIGLEYEKDVPSKTAGVQPAKSITIFSKLNASIPRSEAQSAKVLGSVGGATETDTAPVASADEDIAI